MKVTFSSAKKRARRKRKTATASPQSADSDAPSGESGEVREKDCGT